MLVLSVNLLHPGARDTEAGKPDIHGAEPPRFSAVDYRQSRFPKPAGQPLIGVNYTHYEIENCTLYKTDIIGYYDEPGVAREVHTQLFRMRKAGVATIRTVIWHETSAAREFWGPVPSEGGRLYEPDRSNLIHFLTEIKRFGFARLTIVFSPQGRNNPLRPEYEPSKFRENWRFIRTVRSLVKRYGPRRTRFDLMSEGAPSETPSDWSPVPRQTGRYLAAMYRRYVSHYGNRDVTISSIASEPNTWADRLRNLVRILKSTGEPMPRWYDVHVPYSPAGASQSLQQVNLVLDQEGQSQPLVVGETAYDSRGHASVIKRFLSTTSRPIEEVSTWYQRTSKGCPIAPPYTPGAYATALGHG